MQEIVQEVIALNVGFTDSDEPQFKFTEIFFRQNGELYYTKSKIRLSKNDTMPIFNISQGDVFFVPPEAYQAEWFEGITKYEASTSLPPNAFLKTPPLVDYDPTGSRSMASRVRPEVEILERIKADKDGCHDDIGENIVEYYGCTQSSDGLFITGICLKRYPCTLMDIVREKKGQPPDPEKTKDGLSTQPTDVAKQTLLTGPEKVIEGLIKGIQYLHKLGLIHCDINPSNIMFDENGRPVIIDFDVCVKKDEEAFGGTFGWTDGPDCPAIAVEDIDMRALYRVVIFIHENFTLTGLEIPPNYNGADDDFVLVKNWLAEKIDCAKPWV